MSELINNREKRQEVLKDIIKKLHEGSTVDEVKGEFESVFEGVSATEITEAEAALMKEGISVSEIQSLCDVHAAVFKGTIEEIHQETDPKKIPGHPAYVLCLENRQIEKWLEEIKELMATSEEEGHYQQLIAVIKKLRSIDTHYTKKENLLFPYMEKYGMTAPPQVMWGVDDDIRTLLHMTESMISHSQALSESGKKSIEGVLAKITEMIFKEENIMLPMLIEKLTQDEWLMVAHESDSFGYLISHPGKWQPQKQVSTPKEPKVEALSGEIELPTGRFTVEELMCMLNTLPFDITFVGANDEVKYFSEAADRIFPRTKTVIGRTVSNCHPPTSVHVVEQLVADFKAGKKDQEDFWIHMKDKYVLIRYYAVRNAAKEYLGVLEVTSDIAPIQAITGEKRLVD